MFQKQKINLASRITARSLLVVHTFFQDTEKYEAFIEAAAEGQAQEFLLNHVDHLPEETCIALAQYCKLLNRLEPLSIARMEALFSVDIEDPQLFEEHQNLGILEEWEYLQYEFQDSFHPAHRKIMQLLAEEIRLLDEFAELILSLDPDLQILTSFNEQPPQIPDEEKLIEWLEAEKWMTLGQAVLQHTDPQSDNGLINLNKEFKPILLRAFQKHISFWIKQDGSLTKEEKQHIFSGHGAFLNYVAQREDPQYPAFIALTLDSFIHQFQQSDKYLLTLKELGTHYERIEPKTDADREALIRLYEFVLEHINWLYEDAVQSEDPEFAIRTELELHQKLGVLYAQLWEIESAVSHFKEAATLAYAQEWNDSFEGALFHLLETYQKYLREEKLSSLLPKVLNGDGSWLGIYEKIELSLDLRQTLEVLFLEGLNNRSVEPDAFLTVQKLLKTEIGLDFARQMHQMQKGLNIDTKSFFRLSQQLQATIAPLQSSNEQWLEELEFGVPNLDIYKEKLRRLDESALDLWAPHRLQLQLHQARLGHLENDESCVSSFHHLLPKMEQWPHFSNHKKSFWYTEFVASISLCLEEKPMLLGRLEQAARKALEYIANGFVENYLERTALISTMNELDHLTKALVLNAKRVDTANLRQGVLNLLWNVLTFRQQFANGFLGKSMLAVPDGKAYQQQLDSFRNILWDWHGNRNRTQELSIFKSIREIRNMEFPVWRQSFRLEQFNTPDVPSVIYAFQQKVDGKREVLILSYYPEGGLGGKEDKFQLEMISDFHQIEDWIQEYRLKAGLMWEREGWNSILREPKLMEQLSYRLGRTFHNPANAVEDFMADLNGTQAIRKQFVYADQFLHLFPIESMSAKQGQQLGTSLNIAMVLANPKELQPVNLEKGVLLVSDIPTRGRVKHLPETKLEAAQIERLICAKKHPLVHLQNQAATLEALKQNLNQAKPAVLHLATHGFASEGMPAETAALFLSSDNEGDAGLLGYLDILNLDLHGIELVVLSACNSSVGEIKWSSPMQGLAYAFLQAGADAVLASRRKVNDAATAKIMTHFYSLLLSYEPGEALRQTRLHFIDQPELGVKKQDLASWALFV